MWNLTYSLLFLYIIGLSKLYVNIANAMDVTKKLCDELKADATVTTSPVVIPSLRHQSDGNTNNVQSTTTTLPTANDCTSRVDNLRNVDDNVIEDTIVDMQNDQPDRHFRTPYSYGSVRRQPLPPPPAMQQHMRREELNIVLTKEVLIKQGLLKGMVRVMHDQSGLKNVDQYLGIPYAAAPVGNGRFMPPGMYSIYILIMDAKVS